MHNVHGACAVEIVEMLYQLAYDKPSHASGVLSLVSLTMSRDQ
jgi:hypothetical protein